MIDNIGVDIIENDRFNDYLDNDRRLGKILSIKEREYLATITDNGRKLEYIASRFATKEALIKAGFKFDFNNVWILIKKFLFQYLIINQ